MPRRSAPPARPEPADATADLVVPGLPNAHCHAFQHAMAGHAERSSGRTDTFWTWRDRMYASVSALDADALERTATALYRRLRASGYTSVAEFHYLHRLGPEPGRRASLASALEASQALVRAAAAAGVGLLLLPVLYRWGGFGRAELSPARRASRSRATTTGGSSRGCSRRPRTRRCAARCASASRRTRCARATPTTCAG